ncbi:MAG: hypothetical protein NC230_07050 [Bacteroides sp.]|nr:hypothetical protein [Bacteroides sp.]MCM1413878.1 hypothetical protein [Bacteroides sp.]
MKKYLSMLFVALFATLSFTLTSCGDDDEPDGGNVSASLTINGQGYKEHSTTGASSTITDYSSTRPDLGISIKAELYPSNSDELDFFPRANISLEAEAATLSKGMTLTLNNGYVEMITDVMEGDTYDEIRSGKVTVTDIAGATVTLSFDNLKLADDDNKTVTINGTLKFQYTKI